MLWPGRVACRQDRLAVKKISFAMICVALLLGGAGLWARDAVSRNLPSAFLVSDVAWTAALSGGEGQFAGCASLDALARKSGLQPDRLAVNSVSQ